MSIVKIVDFVSCFQSKLRYELATDKPLTPITDGTSDNDASVWNTYLERESSRLSGDSDRGVTWFTGRWMHVECYAYRRMLQACRKTETLKEEDFFQV